MPEIRQGYVCDGREDFVEHLRWWLANTDEDTIGGVGNFGGKAWLFVEAGAARCHLNADTARAGVQRFLELVDEHGPGVDWRVITNNRGKVNRVAIGPDVEKIKKFYLYTDTELAAPVTL